MIHRLQKAVARAWLRASGWSFEGDLPAARSYVVIAAPHTSNWDFVYMMLMAWHMRLRFGWMGKASLFRWPFGGVLRALGGIPIRRDRRANLVQQCAERFAQDPELIVVVPAEGTRGRGTLWRSGFYHIARTARVPVVLGYLDYARKRGGFGPALVPSGDIPADMDRIRAFYADKTGRHPERFTEPRLAEEAVPPEPPARTGGG